MRKSQNSVEAILGEALALPKEDRAHFLKRRCGGDVQLQRQVQMLLDAIANNAELLAETQVQAKPSAENKCQRTP